MASLTEAVVNCAVITALECRAWQKRSVMSGLSSAAIPLQRNPSARSHPDHNMARSLLSCINSSQPSLRSTPKKDPTTTWGALDTRP